MFHSRTSSKLAVSLVALAAVAGLSGCSVGFTADENAANTDAAEVQETTPEVTEDTADGTETSAGELDIDSDDVFTRAELEAAVTKEINCSGGSVTIDDIGAVIGLGEDCANVEITGAGAILVAESITNLDISATGTVVFAAEIGAVNVTGSGNVVTWESGSPTISDTGITNVLTAQ